MNTKKLRWPAAAVLLLVPVVLIGPSLRARSAPGPRDPERCDEHRLTSPTGERARRVLPAYLAQFGCQTFREMDTIEDMIVWCEAHHLGDTVSSDVELGCRPGVTPGDCERFWVCE